MIISLHTECEKEINAHFSAEANVLWLYLGKKAVSRRRLESNFSERFKRIDIARLHNRVAKDIRTEHVLWIDDMNRRWGSDIHWWFSSISSRNVYVSDLFQNCCYLEILERLRASGTVPDLIIVESPGLAATICAWAYKLTIPARYINRYRLRLMSFRMYGRCFARWCLQTAAIFLRFFSFALLRNKFRHNLPVEPYVIIDTFLHDYCIDERGSFTDRYFPHLHEYFSTQGIRVVTHPVLYGFAYGYRQIFKKLSKSPAAFIVREQYLRFQDYLEAVVYPIVYMLRYSFKAVLFRQFEMSALLREEKISTCLESMEPILIYRTFLRLGQARVPAPRAIVNWYENQVIDKALIAGARQAFPETPVMGIQMFVPFKNLLNLYPTQSEYDRGLSPHIVLASSEHLCKTSQVYTRDIPYRAVASLRYQHVFQEQQEKYGQTGNYTILVIAPFTTVETIEILESLRYSIGSLPSDITVLIKGHPDYDSEELLKAYGEEDWPAQFELVCDSVQELFSKASLVISSSTSGLVEAVALGIPVIFMGNQTSLSFNPLEGVETELLAECFTKQEMRKAIENFIAENNSAHANYQRLAESLRACFFTPITDESMKPFMEFELTSYVS